MNWRKVSKIIVIGTAVLWILYDFIPFLNPERGDTLSEVIATYGLHLFSVPFAFGTLCGHFFFPRDGRYPKPKILLPTAAFLIMMDIFVQITHNDFLQKLQTYPGVMLLLGIPFGAYFWTQQKSDKL